MKNRVVLILSIFPQLSESFIINKFVGLNTVGFDMYVFCSQINYEDWHAFPSLNQGSNIGKRIRSTWPIRPLFMVILLYPFALLKCVAANPKGLMRYLYNGWKTHKWKILKRFYLDFQLILLKPDLIHFEFGATAPGRSDLGHLLGCKEVVSFRGYDLNFSGLDQTDYYSSVWKDADAFHFLGQDLHRRALKRGFLENKPFVLIPPAIDTQFFNPGDRSEVLSAGTQQKHLRILSVGRLEWKKGYEFAFQAVKQLVDRGIACEYHIIGTGAYLAPLMYARHQLGLDEKIRFLGALPKEKVREQLQWACVFLHAAVSEGFCNAAIEAQAMQIPVVCTDADGLPENVADEATGFVVPRRAPLAMAEKLELLARSPALRKKMGLAGRKRVQEMFQLENQISRFDQFYRHILENK